MSDKFDLNYEPFSDDSKPLSFSERIKREVKLSKDERYQKYLKDQDTLRRKNELIDLIKEDIIRKAKNGKNECWFDMNRHSDFWDQDGSKLSKDLDGLEARWHHSSGSCGNHGYNSYSDYYYIIKW